MGSAQSEHWGGTQRHRVNWFKCHTRTERRRRLRKTIPGTRSQLCSCSAWLLPRPVSPASHPAMRNLILFWSILFWLKLTRVTSDCFNQGSYLIMYFKSFNLFFKRNNYLFECAGSQLWHMASSSLSYSMRDFNSGKWDLVLWPGIKPGTPALEAWSLSHWTTREVPQGRDAC